MTKKREVRVLSAPETAWFLRCALGPEVAWETWLTDVRRNRIGLSGELVLLPVARIKERCNRPVYAVNDIETFIREYRRCNPHCGPKKLPVVRTIELDEDDRRHWKLRKVAEHEVRP